MNRGLFPGADPGRVGHSIGACHFPNNLTTIPPMSCARDKTRETPPGPRTVISVHRLSKRYGSLTAVNRLTLDVFPGEIFGFLGLNGAGKTTTIRILLDLLRPTSGSATVLGHDCQVDGLKVRNQVGYLPGELGLYRDMTGLDLLDLLARVGGRTVDQQERRRLLERMELPAADLRRKLREYSTGMKRKLGIIQAFEGDPSLLILDEPTEGLDPIMQETFYEMAFAAKRQGRTIFMSSHVLSEVEKVCDRIGVIAKGELVLLSPVEEVRKLVARRVRVTFRQDVSLDSGAPLDGYEVVERSPRLWDLRVLGELGGLVEAMAGLPVKDLEVEEPHLEDVLIKYYRGGAS